jgi:hypothetical protein
MELGSGLTEVFFLGGYGSGFDVSSQDYGVLSMVDASLDQHPIDLTALKGILWRRN